ncbi:hypothetical protein WA026_000909 [Henosepilachna vigintioctopunctata]|uniref:Gustatory receptor n=1 Tax=Henosepilachna vigintioctopunctata TaxID=420089 RepID=A0AAW1V021_9CUCU
MRTVKKLIYKYSGKPSNVYCSIYPLINICSYLCLIPYNVKKKTEFRTQHPKWFRTFNILLIVSIISLVIWNISSLAEHCRNSNTPFKLKYYQEEAISLLALCAILTCSFNAKELIRVFCKLESIDESLKLLHLTPNHSDTYVNVTLTLILLLVYISIIIFWTTLECSGLVPALILRKCTLTNSLEKIIFGFYILMIHLQYYQYLVLVEGREKLLNGFLKDLISRKLRKYNDTAVPVKTLTDELDNDRKFIMVKGMDLSDMVNHVANIHIKLEDVAISINKIFEKQQL